MIFLFSVLRISYILCFQNVYDKVRYNINAVTLALDTEKYTNIYGFFNKLDNNTTVLTNFYNFYKNYNEVVLTNLDDAKNLHNFVKIRYIYCGSCVKATSSFFSFFYYINYGIPDSKIKDFYCQKCFLEKIFKSKDTMLYNMELYPDNYISTIKNLTFNEILFFRVENQKQIFKFKKNIELKKFYNAIKKSKDLRAFFICLINRYTIDKDMPSTGVPGKNIYSLKIARIARFIEQYDLLPLNAKYYLNTLFLNQLDIFDQFESDFLVETVNFLLLTPYFTFKIIKFGHLMKTNGSNGDNLIKNPCNYFFFINSVYKKFTNDEFNKLLKTQDSKFKILYKIQSFINEQMDSDDYSYEEKTYLKFEKYLIGHIIFEYVEAKLLPITPEFKECIVNLCNNIISETVPENENKNEIPNVIKFRMCFLQLFFSLMITL